MDPRQFVTEKAEAFRVIVATVAPFLEYNPRRIKQFVNLLRLRTFIAAETGLFDKAELTLPQLGKFIALSLRMPLLLTDLSRDETLLAQLQTLAVEGLDSDVSQTSSAPILIP